MSTKSKSKTFIVSVAFSVDLGVSVSADSLEQALEKARALKVVDILDLDGLEYNDSSEIKVSGLFEG